MTDMEMIKQTIVKIIIDSEFGYITVIQPVSEFDKQFDEAINELADEKKICYTSDRGFIEVSLSDNYKQELGIDD
jgi:hypothetical protein